jgi:hypothetical protein
MGSEKAALSAVVPEDTNSTISRNTFYLKPNY